MTARLPVPGSDDDTWGTILNQYLEVSLNGDGTLQTAAITQAGGEVTSDKGQADGYAGLNSSGAVPSAQLGSGTADNTTYLRGDGTWATPASGSSTLGSDTDVSISSPAGGQLLTYDNTSSKWTNQNAPTTPDATTGSVGVVQLAGDLGGTATDPSVLKVNGVTVSGTPSSGQVITATNGTAANWTAPDTSASIAFAITFG